MSETTCPFHDDGHTLNECPSRPIESIKASQHVAHCNRGEHVGHCKYGPNEWCPVFMVIADHDAARDLADAVEALDDARRALGTGDCTVTDCEGCKEDAAYARNAIADFFAARPELAKGGE